MKVLHLMNTLSVGAAELHLLTVFLSTLRRLLSAAKPDTLHRHFSRADFAGGFARVFDPDLIGVYSLHLIMAKIRLELASVEYRFGLPPLLPALKNHRMIISMT